MKKTTSTRNTNRIQSFRYAFEGIFYLLRTQENAWIHAGITILATIVGLVLGISLLEWAILALAAMGVWVAEAINTAVEAVVDLASPDLHPLAKVGKDTAAGAVLIAAIFAVIIGLLVFGPHLFRLLWPLLNVN